MPRINRAPVNTARGGMENVTVGGAVANIVVELMTWLPEGWSSPTIAVNVGVLVTAGVAMGASILRNRGILPSVAPTALVLLVASSLLLVGCTGAIGHVKPHEFTVVDADGQAIVVACELKGVAWGGGDGGICRVDDDGYVSTVEGGRASETFRDIMAGLWDGVGRIVGGLFGGLGAAFTSVGQGASGG